MQGLPSVSIIVPTRDRPEVLAELLKTIVVQSYPPLETLVVDDSPTKSAKKVVSRFDQEFRNASSRLEYLPGTSEGTTAALNIGIATSRGDALLFLGDDILLDQETVRKLAEFLESHPEATGVQPVITGFEEYWNSMNFGARFENTIRKALMLSYHAMNRQGVRRSAASVYGSLITRPISVQRTTGCCLFRRCAVGELRFDTKLSRRGLYDDLDFSYNVYRKHPGTLFCVPDARIIHTASREARQSRTITEYKEVVYWSYIFFKDRYEGSLLNLLAFWWAFAGGFVWSAIQFALSKNWMDKRAYIHRLEAYGLCLRKFRSIKRGELDFFNLRYQ